MRQVPENKNKTSYLIVGDGRLSKHFQNYFSQKGIPFKIWTRRSKKSLKSYLISSNRILILIKDDEIENFLNLNKSLTQSAIWIHCSGILSTPLAESAHPLMTFSDQLYDLKTYESIPFILEKGRMKFNELFPELVNPHFTIDSKEKALYHTYCVMSGNFTTILWQYFFDYLKSVGIPKSAAHPYLREIANNIISSTQPLSGPFNRNDTETINRHIEVLKDSPLRNIYVSFWNAFERRALK